MRITKIQLKHFRAFRGEYTIDLHGGKNLLVYGENGSGKSSLYEALARFFALTTPFVDYRNFFVTTDDGYVKLEIGDDTNPPILYEWEETTHPSSQALIMETAKTKGFLDYRALLETHFEHRQASGVNVFYLLVNTLLANIQNPISQSYLAVEWHAIEQLIAERRSQSRDERLHQTLSDFNLGITSLLSALVDKTNQVLGFFRQNVTVQLALPTPGLTVEMDGKTITNRDIVLTTEYYGKLIPRHHLFLNEARLSAIAISIYLGALLLNPPSQLRLLFLDDVLIGLDMSNRLPLLDVLTQLFVDWQVILTTYDRVWFEMARQRLQDQHPGWDAVEFFCGITTDGDLPLYQQAKDYLGAAKQHLADNDLKAAALYIRSAYEHAVKRFCDKHNLPVRYCENPKELKSDDFWQVVKKQKLKTGADAVPTSLVTDIELFRSAILNQLSHTAPVSAVRKEVEDARKAVETLQQVLHGIGRGTLQ